MRESGWIRIGPGTFVHTIVERRENLGTIETKNHRFLGGSEERTTRRMGMGWSYGAA